MGCKDFVAIFLLFIVIFTLRTLSLQGMFSPHKLHRSITKMKMSTLTTNSIKNYVLTYKYVADIIEKRGPHRPAHLALAEDLVQRGVLIAAGAYTPPDGAQFIFKSTLDDVNRFVSNDPYVKNGLVVDYKIKEWNVVVGKL